MASIKHRLGRLEQAVPPPLPTKSSPMDIPLTPEERRRRFDAMLADLLKRGKEIDAALASDEPERRA